jgi:glycerol-3-phosphate dehydrogenase
MNRDQSLSRIRTAGQIWDLVIVGGGATGVGVAVDAAQRGYSVALLEQSDFGKGTSSRSTKLIHGGVRYLQQGNIPLVMEALKERGILRRNAPALVRDQKFVVPNYSWWEAPFYGIGMKVYDGLAGKYGFGRSRILSKEETLERLPTIETDGLLGGVEYHDGQFDDARLLIHLARTAADQGATLANYVRVEGLLKARPRPGADGGSAEIEGVRARDLETDEEFEVRARVVINATGAFTDGLRQMDEPSASAIVRPSQGVHVVLPKKFLPGDSAIMVPRTDDGRVLFAIPWLDVVVVGTTDTPIEDVDLEPRAQEEEIDFLMTHTARYLDDDPTDSDVLSIFAGIRPLVAHGAGHDGDGGGDTAAISREHALMVSPSGLITIAGGKWTTYRKMAEDVVDHAAVVAGLKIRKCRTKKLPIVGGTEPEVDGAAAPDATVVAHAVRNEMARTVDDVLARRTRRLLLDAAGAAEDARAVADLMAGELGRDSAWAEAQVSEFRALAAGYRLG